MYEAENPAGLNFDPETLRRMRAVFGGETCCLCEADAERLCGGRFFCREHYPRNRKEPSSKRVYHCQIAEPAGESRAFA